MTKAETHCVTLGAIGFLWLHGLICLAQGQPDSSKHLDLKTDPRLKVPITTNFKKPKVRDLLDLLEKSTRLKFSTNDKVEMKEEGFGSVSFRNTPAWIVMQELVKSHAVKGRWEKTGDGYMLVGSLNAKARDALAVLAKTAPIAVKTPEPPPHSSGQFWIFVAVMAIPGAIVAGWSLVHRWRGRSPSSGKGS